MRQSFKPPSLQASYPTAIHASTGITPFEMMFGHIPQQPPFPEPTAYGIFYLSSKLAQLTDFVKAHMTKAAHKQKLCYDQCTIPCSFKAGDAVWLTSCTNRW